MKLIPLISFFLFLISNFVKSSDEGQKLIVGTFNTAELLILNFQYENGYDLKIEQVIESVANQSWLTLNKDGNTLLTSNWISPPSISSYHLSKSNNSQEKIEFRNMQTVKSLVGYIGINPIQMDKNGRAYTAGGESGSVFAIDFESSTILTTLQESNYTSGETSLTDAGKDPKKIKQIKGIGENTTETDQTNNGLNHGAHCSQPSPDGSLLFVGDLGRNCIWVQYLEHDSGLILKTVKVEMRKPNLGPRHISPHPNGKYIYVVQEEENCVDVFEVQPQSNPPLKWKQGVKIIPDNVDSKKYWSDEVHTIPNPNATEAPSLLIASTRGRETIDKGYVTLFQLDQEGLVKLSSNEDNGLEQKGDDTILSNAWVSIYQTPTSGGFADVITPSPKILHNPKQFPFGMMKGQYIVMTEDIEGSILMFTIEYTQSTPKLRLVNRLFLDKDKHGSLRQPSVALWL